MDVYQPAECQPEPEPDQEFTTKLPNKTSYKDIHGGMKSKFPNVSRARVDEYLAQFDKKLDAKIKDLYNKIADQVSRPGLQICNTKFNYLQLIRFSFKITSKQFLYLRGPMLPLYNI